MRPLFPVRLSSWRGRLRGGLVAALASDAPAAAPGLAEVLMHDRERLHKLQVGRCWTLFAGRWSRRCCAC